MKLSAAAAFMAVVALLVVGCGGSSNTADYKACKAMIKADMANSLSSVSSGKLPENLPTAAAARCSHLSKADMTRLMREVANELNSSPTAGSSPATAGSGLQFPARLLGLSKNTSPDAQAAAQALRRSFAIMRTYFRGAQAAIYDRNIEVVGGRWSSSAARRAESGGFDKSFAAGAVQDFMQGSGHTRMRSFPAGPHGGALDCGNGTTSAGATIFCAWADKVTAAWVFYLRGSASSLGDAASKTNQIRSVVEP
jgi:hypothetical protein